MSKRARQNSAKQKETRKNVALYAIAGLLFVIAGIVLATRQATASVHPHPRDGAEQMQVENANRYGDYPEAKEAYEMAQHIKSTLDGLFCYCYCKGGGHYSLLDCFKDDHGAACDICIGEAKLAYQMVQQGKSLEEIRVAIDQTFGKS